MSTTRFPALPSIFLGKDKANARITAYLNGKHATLTDSMGGITETKSIFYSIDQVEMLFKELVYLNADGLRIYFGTYEDADTEAPGQLCLIMVPTRDSGDEGHEDVIVEDDVDFPDRAGSEDFMDPDASKAYNYGAPCPTICPSVLHSKYPLIVATS